MTFEHQYNGVYFVYAFSPTGKASTFGGSWFISDRPDGEGIVCKYDAFVYSLSACIEAYKETHEKMTMHKSKVDPKFN